MELYRTCIRFREMLAAFIRRELRQRYVGSVLGRPWPFLQPLILLGVYWLVFMQLLDVKLEASFVTEMFETESDADVFQIVMLCAGLVAWLFTAEFINRATNIVMENGGLVKKVAFPSELLPVSLLASYLFNLVVLFAVLSLIVWVTTPFFSSLLWMFPIVLLLHGLFLLGVAYLLATANVFVRDVGQLVPLITSLWFFLTPIVYLREALAAGGKSWIWVFDWNPMTYVVEAYRRVLYVPADIRYTLDADGAPRYIGFGDVWADLGLFAVVAIATATIGYRVFMASKHKFADEL